MGGGVLSSNRGGPVRRQLTTEDLAMVAQWVVCCLVAPFLLLPLFPRQPMEFSTRLMLVVGAFIFSAVMTAVYLVARRHSRHAASHVANITAVFDAGLVFGVLLVYPRFLPEAFWILAILVIVVSVRFGYREAVATTLGFSALYMLTIFAGYGTSVDRTVIADAIFRLMILWLIAAAACFMTQSEKRERREARILARIASAIASTLDVDELMQAVVEGISEAAGGGRCTAFLVSSDHRWAVPKHTTESDREARDRLFARRIDLKGSSAAARALEEGEPVLAPQAQGEPLPDGGWAGEFGSRVLAVLPVMVRDNARGMVVVEGRGARRRLSEHQLRVCSAILDQASAGLDNALRYADEQRRRSEADTLYRASRELGSTLELDQVLENACRLAERNTGASGCAAFLLDTTSGRLVPRLMLGRGARRTAFEQGSGIDLDEFEELYNLATRPPALARVDPGENAVLPPFLRSAGKLLMAPFYIKGTVGGLLCAFDTEPGDFDEAQSGKLALVASEVALAVMNARLHERIKADAAQMASLVRLASAIGSTADLPTILKMALQSVRQLFDCTAGLIYRLEESDGTMRCVESFGYEEEILARISSPPYPSIEECWTVSEGRLIGVDDLARTRVSCRTLQRIGRGSVMCVGMQAEGRTLGVLHVRSDNPDAFGEQDQQMALAFADQVGLAMQRAVLFEEINRLAVTDPLTGVFNVRRLEASLAEEVSRARRYRRPVSFLMVDVDNLKAYNDNLGHQQGDIVLSQIASIVDSSTRDADKVFRYGGDEFCVILPETDSQEAAVVAEKVRRAVAEFHFPGEEKIPGQSVTVSVGLASFPRDCEEEASLVRKADLALYSAKQTGRNSVARSF